MSPREAGSALRRFAQRNSGLLRSASGTGVLKFTNVGLAFATSIVLTRTLGVEDYGVYALVISLVSVVFALAKFGLGEIALREAAAAVEREDFGWARAVSYGALRASVGIGLLGALLTLGVLVVMPAADDIAVGWLGLTSLLVLLQVVASTAEGGQAGLGAVVQSQVPMLLLLPVLFVVAIVFVADIGDSDLSASVALALRVVVTAIAAAVGLWMLWSKVRHLAPNDRHRPRLPAGWLRAGAYIAGSGSLLVLSANADLLVLGVLADASDVGSYKVATRGAELISYGAVVIRAPLAPVVSKLYTSGKTARLQESVRTSARMALGFGFVVAVGLVVLRGPYFDVFGNDFGTPSAEAALILLVLAHLSGLLAGPTSELMTMTGHERVMLRAVGISTLLNITLNFALIPFAGVVGAAVATAVSLAGWNLTLVSVAKRELGVATSPLARRHDAK